MAVIPHALYSPDLAPCDFFLFPKMKLKLKGRRFDTIEEIQVQSVEALRYKPEGRGFDSRWCRWNFSLP
jgi:hypothetical protein